MFASSGALQAARENFVADPAPLRARTRSHRPSLAAAVLSLVALGTFLVLQLGGGPAYHHGISSAQRQRLASAYARLPLNFEENRGQTDPRVRFLAHGPGFGLFLTSRGPVLSLAHAKSAGDVLALRLLGGAAHPRLQGLGRLAATANYLVGSDRTRWRAGVPTFSRVRYAQVWPGVSVDFHGNRSRLEYDLNLAPGADPARVGFAFAGARSLRLSASGDLLVGLAHGGLRQPRPLAYQWLGSHRQPVPVPHPPPRRAPSPARRRAAARWRRCAPHSPRGRTCWRWRAG